MTRTPRSRLEHYLAPWASLRLTVVLLAMATFLVFAGTVAQVDKGIWTVVEEYFRCAFAWISLDIFLPRSWDVPEGIGVYFPGGWLIGGALFVNLLAAHIIRFKIHASGGKLFAGVFTLVLGALVTGMVIAGVFDEQVAATEDDAFWRVLIRLGKGGGAAIVLMIGCQLVFAKRGGIVLIHGGIILLLISEFITGTFAEEGRMRIEAGQSMNYVEHMRRVELVLIDRSDPTVDRVIAVPGRELVQGKPVQQADLPVDVTVVQLMKNSRLLDAMRAGGAIPNIATKGAGLRAIAQPDDEASGTDVNQTIDIPAAYVSLRDRSSGADLGTYLVSPWLEGTGLGRQVVTAGGIQYDLGLRFARSYKPYRIELIEFRHDVYVGTDKPKNFSSLVRVVDEDAGVDRTVKIWMNNPLRYAGETFYQSSFEPGKQVTILQVVRNDGWMIPYLSCMFVGVGMSVHMGAKLITFLRRRVA